MFLFFSCYFSAGSTINDQSGSVNHWEYNDLGMESWSATQTGGDTRGGGTLADKLRDAREQISQGLVSATSTGIEMSDQTLHKSGGSFELGKVCPAFYPIFDRFMKYNLDLVCLRVTTHQPIKRILLLS